MTSLQPTQLLNTEERINQAVALLKAGECVALPTETVYGLAADACAENSTRFWAVSYTHLTLPTTPYV